MTAHLPLIFPSRAGCASPVECHRRLGFTLITLSLMGRSGLDGQPRQEYLKCVMRVSSEEAGDPCSSSLSFKVLSLEAACSCPRLFAAGGVRRGRRASKPCVFEQQVVSSELPVTSCALHARRLLKREVTKFPSIHLF